MLTPNKLTRFRATTFASKEPETLTWIESFDTGAVFWDVGANVGIYTIYAALKVQAKVIAFEPSVFNLEILTRNIVLNDLENSVTISPLPLNVKSEVGSFHLQQATWGGALSQFGQKKQLEEFESSDNFNYQMISLTMDHMCDSIGLYRPDCLKIDVDGNEYLILEGGQNILKTVKTVLVEVDDNMLMEAAKTAELLSRAGLTLVGKYQQDYLKMTKYAGLHNQIWRR